MAGWQEAKFWQARLNLLEKEREILLGKWFTVNGSEKARLLVKIMDIEEQLELDKRDNGKIGSLQR
ncbi:hypothetical protein [Zhaonella formicivorans]|jgi:hypothetical protein|uniref:hypothetical protein n=1 Tax=Zhaonella formicivorans TaxID=2528593 RepID=UPI001D105553|nr:hypothetical protein [Zhaonella formicivorans]